ncbi:hypothetical protein Vadar_022610 [Vaccinium darrowii]|uniref:Uncharacterized protein n=1 Tax=Vaccinium darrowii TaxID=229202 RepID=A0ACB7YP82_9ERIC|nr:hypothetical protein Vadar_022610 [Vaccinium darrowii]
MGSTTKKGQRGPSFTIEEDETIVLAYLNVSLDAVQGTDQKQKTYWRRVWEFIQENKPKSFVSERHENSLMNRWSVIQLAVNKFCGRIAQVEAKNQSGMNEEGKLDQARDLYNQFHGGLFQFEHYWNKLKFQPKWLLDLERKNSKKNRSSTVPSPPSLELVDLGETDATFVDLERPKGHTKAWCYEMIGYPEWWDPSKAPSKRNSKRKHPASVAVAEPSNNTPQETSSLIAKTGYSCYHPPSRKTYVALDVTFHEDEMYYSTPESPLQGGSDGGELETLLHPLDTLDLINGCLDISGECPDQENGSNSEGGSSQDQVIELEPVSSSVPQPTSPCSSIPLNQLDSQVDSITEPQQASQLVFHTANKDLDRYRGIITNRIRLCGMHNPREEARAAVATATATTKAVGKRTHLDRYRGIITNRIRLCGMHNPREEARAAVATAATKAVGKRTRKTGSTEGELIWLYSPIPEQHSRTICFRAAHHPTCSIDFYCLPVDDDADELHCRPPKHIIPFQSSTNISRSSSFAAVGNSMYCVGGHNARGKESSAIYRFDTTGGQKGFWYPNSFDMCCPRVAPSTIVMDGKIFIIGAQVVSDGAPLAEVFDLSSKSSLVVEAPPASLHESVHFVTAALCDRNQILVACTFANDAYLLDVKAKAWVKVDPNVDFAAVNRQAAVVLKTTMCWCDDTLHKLVAYDLNLKMWFKTSIKGLKRVGRRLKDVDLSDFSLFPLDENHLCLLWVDHVNRLLLHCTKVSVSLLDNRFCATVAFSQSYVLKDNSSFVDGLLLEEGRAAVAMVTTKAVEKRTHKIRSTKGLKWFYSLIPEQHRRTICFRASDHLTRSIDFYCIPSDDDFDEAADDGQLPELSGRQPKLIFPFQSSSYMSRSSSFAAVGNSMYCVGGHDAEGIETSAIHRFDTTGGYKGFWYPNSFDMCCPRVAPSTLVMDGKLFIIGSKMSDDGPVAEVLDPSSKSSLIVESPPAALNESLYFVTAALPDRNQILVACTYTKDAYLLDVKAKAWVNLDPIVDFTDVSRQAAVVLKTTMCWCADRLRKLVAYDLNLKLWFETSIKDLKMVGRRLKDVELAGFSLFPVDENLLCLLWVDHVNRRLLHCTKVRVSLSDNRFCAAVASSRSYVIKDNSSFVDGLLLDLTSIPEEGSTSRDIGREGISASSNPRG